jgi:hypothetical protein
MTNDPLELLTGGTNPTSTALDLTNNPIVQAAIEASYQQEAQIQAAKVVVGIVSRALEMVPVWGPALGNVITGAGNQSEIVAGINAQLAAQASAGVATGSTSGSSCPLSGFLQSQQVQGLIGQLAKNPALAQLARAIGL